MKLIKLLGLSLIAAKTVQAQTIPSYVPLTNLEAWLPFDSSYNDVSGNANDAVNYGTTYTEDRCGNPNSAIYFNGNFQKLIINNSILPDTPTSYSIAFWVKRVPELNKKVEIINDRGTNSWNYKYRVLLSSSNSNSPQDFSHLLVSHIDPYNIEGLYAHEPDTTAWEHVVMVYDKDLQQQYIYSNGLQIANRTIITERYPQHSNGTYIGYSTVPTNGTNEDNPFKGSLDDIGFWSRSLDIKEIIKLYQGSCRLTDTSTSISGHIYNNEKLAVYPNPATGTFTVTNNRFDQKVYSIKVINNLGQIVYQKDHNTPSVLVELKQYNSGSYYIYLIDHKNTVQSIKEIILK